jgi:2-polyprenyl-6-methoxyphenol hydroxylase-like FAD-dependent oxidoreductase
MKKNIKIGIVGAGIGGLVLGKLLIKAGFSIQIFEQSKKLRSSGAGIILASNATQILKELGLYSILFEKGNELNDMNITDETLDVLLGNDISAFEEELKVKNIAIKREILHGILSEDLTELISLDKELVSINETDNKAVLTFKDKSKESFDLVVGADGLNSSVRTYVDNKCSIRDAKQICWRGLSSFELPTQYSQSLNEAWGKGKRFGFVNLGNGTVYWYALANEGVYSTDQTVTSLAETFRDFNPLVTQILENTKDEKIYKGEIKDLQPIKSWYKSKVCLIGDAAHATTPNLGQGACQAIESAYVLANAISKFDSTNLVFEHYQKARIKKAHMVTDTSWKIGKMAHMENNFLRKFRNFGMKMTPDKMSYRKNKDLFTIH